MNKKVFEKEVPAASIRGVCHRARPLNCRGCTNMEIGV